MYPKPDSFLAISSATATDLCRPPEQPMRLSVDFSLLGITRYQKAEQIAYFENKNIGCSKSKT
jgi:hypothetical protein